jgi:uncharacterized membrane protein
MKRTRDFLINALIGGLLVVLPIYLAILLLLKAMKSVAGLVRPIAAMFPEWLPAENLLALLAVLVFSFFVGAAVRTRAGRAVRERLEISLFEKLPGYAVIRGMAQRMAGKGDENEWKPVLAEIEDALVPAFIVEELDDGRFTVFVPSVPTPFAGAVYILARERVHLIDVPFTQAMKSVSRWGSGSKELVAAMKSVPSP